MSGLQSWDTFQDFVIKIESIGQEKYRAEVLSPTGKANTVFTIPFDQKDLEIFLLKVGRPRSAPGRGRVPKPMRQTVEFGGQLFDAVLSGAVGEVFTTARREADLGGYGLRLRLQFSEAPELANLPWEYLYDGRDFLALSDTTPVMRYLDLPNPPRPMEIGLPLRILLTVSAPHDQAPIDIDVEKAKINEALAGLINNNKVEIFETEDATLNSLQRTLRAEKSQGRPFHIWHYIGHGLFDPVEDASVLVFCDEFGMSNKVGGFELGTLFKNYPETRIALLNACEGARTDQEDPFAGVATALVERGIPAVIGMQFEISDQAAIRFSSEFYSALVDGLPVDAACTNARRAVFFLPNFVEWATPVLYMRSPDGRIFDLSQESATTPVPGDPENAAGEEIEKRLLQLYNDANEAYWLENWEKAVAGFQSVIDLRPEHQDASAKLEIAVQQLRLSTLYSTAIAAEAAGDWGKAESSLEQIITDQPGYKDALGKLEQVRRKTTLADLYTEARMLSKAHKWEAVLKVLNEISEIDPETSDPDNLARTARIRLAEQTQEDKVESLYSQALHEMDQGEWRKARDLLNDLTGLQPGYKESERLIIRMEDRLSLEGLPGAAQRSVERPVPARVTGQTRARPVAKSLAGLGGIVLLWWRVGLLFLAAGYNLYLFWYDEIYEYVSPTMVMVLVLPFGLIGLEYVARNRWLLGAMSLTVAVYWAVDGYILETGYYGYGFSGGLASVALVAAFLVHAALFAWANYDAYRGQGGSFFR